VDDKALLLFLVYWRHFAPVAFCAWFAAFCGPTHPHHQAHLQNCCYCWRCALLAFLTVYKYRYSRCALNLPLRRHAWVYHRFVTWATCCWAHVLDYARISPLFVHQCDAHTARMYKAAATSACQPNLDETLVPANTCLGGHFLFLCLSLPLPHPTHLPWRSTLWFCLCAAIT